MPVPVSKPSKQSPVLLDRVAIFAVPLVAGAVTAAVLLGPGAERPALGAQARARVVRGAERCALRVKTLAHERARFSARPYPELRVELLDGQVPLGSWRGATDEAGLAEAMIDLSAPARGPLEVVISSAAGQLARGPIETDEPLAVVDASVLAATPGQPRLELRLPRASLVPELPEVLELTAFFEGAALEPRLELDVHGADSEVRALPARCQQERCSKRWLLTITPRAPLIELALELKLDGGRSNRWEGQLAVRAGGIWLDPDSLTAGELRLRAGSPHDVAYVSLVSPLGRFWGGVVAMAVDPQGRSSARLELPDLPPGPLTALVSTDPSEGEASTIAWPLRPELGRVEAGRAPLVVDSMPEAIAEEKRRQGRARWPAFGLIASAGLFELFYLWHRHRRSRRRLRAHLEQNADFGTGAAGKDEHGAMISREPLAFMVLLCGGLLLAFFMLAAVAAWVR